MSTATIDHTILCQAGPVTVQAQPATPGLYVYEGPDAISGGACRWRLGHHSGLQVARFQSSEAAHAAAAAVMDLADWTAPASELQSTVFTRMVMDSPNANVAWERLDFVKRIYEAGGHFDFCVDCRP